MRIVRSTRIARVLLASACAAAVVLAPTAAKANPPSLVTSLTCHSGTSAITITPYTPKISVNAGGFNVNGSVWCRMVRTGDPRIGAPPFVLEAAGQFYAFGSFAEVVDGTGTAGGTIQVLFAGAMFNLPFAAVFANGVGPLVISGGTDTDGSYNGVGAGSFVELVCPIPGCAVSPGGYVALNVELQHI